MSSARADGHGVGPGELSGGREGHDHRHGTEGTQARHRGSRGAGNPAPHANGDIPAPSDHRTLKAFGRFRDKPSRTEFERHALEHRADLYRFAFWVTRDPFVAEDAVQEALLRAWRSWDTLRDKGAVKHWFLTIVRRECARMYSRKRHPTTHIDDLGAAEQYLIAVEDDTDLHDIRRAILRLDGTYREPLILQVLMGQSMEQIARILGITRGAVLTSLCRARETLMVEISESLSIPMKQPS